MRLNRIKSLLFVGLATASLSSCYDSILDYSDTTTQGGGSSTYNGVASAKLGVQLLRAAQPYLINTNINQYQYERNLHVDDFAGYLSVPHNFEHRLPSSFYFCDEFAGGIVWELKRVAPQVIPVCISADTLGISSLGAAAKAMFCFGALQYTNCHGPIPYDDYKTLKEDHPMTFQKQSEVYTEIFADLISADSTLAAYQANPVDSVDRYWEEMDRVSNKTKASEIVVQWRKFVNSLILRMAVTAHKRKEYTFRGMTLQKLAEDAVKRGVFEAGDPIFGWNCGSNTDAGYNKAAQICSSWADSRLNASFDNILKRTNNPLREKWFTKNTGFVNKNGKSISAGTEIMSIRSGVVLSDRSASVNNYKAFSYLNDNFLVEPMCLFRSEESIFLRAEAALYGWDMGGTAKDFYEMGVKEMFSKRGLSSEQYDNYMSWRGTGDRTNAATADNYIYHDYFAQTNDIKAWDGYFKLNNAWDGIDTNPYTNATGVAEKEIQLEKIMTQKWIANFPESVVAWTDYRRTGYPRLLPACKGAYKDADGSIYDDSYNINTGEILTERLYMRRMPYTGMSDSDEANDIVTSAIPALNEETTGNVSGDMQGTRLWWDVKEGNF